MLAADCPDIHSECTETGDLVRCECLTHWEGDDCNACPEFWDPEQDCDACLGNRDLATDCTTCTGNWDLATGCTTCLAHWDLATGCTACEEPWEGDRCQTLAGFDFWPCALASACFPDEEFRGHFGTYCSQFFLTDAIGDQSRSSERAVWRSQVACMTDATDCDEMRECFEASPSEAAACTAPGEHHCVGDVRVTCPYDPDETISVTDCAAAGLVCGQIGIQADCGVAICDPATDTRYCDDDVLYECMPSGVWETRDCAFDKGSLCVDLGSGNFTCTGDGPACDPPTHEGRCEGSSMVHCYGSGEALVDCTRYHDELTCTTQAGAAFPTCVFPENECFWETAETCTGGVIRFCLMGRFVEVDCTVYGFSGCQTDQINGYTIAYCVD
jgi:hypothetical protein